jgi:hypothetical protein
LSGALRREEFVSSAASMEATFDRPRFNVTFVGQGGSARSRIGGLATAFGSKSKSVRNPPQSGEANRPITTRAVGYALAVVPTAVANPPY